MRNYSTNWLEQVHINGAVYALASGDDVFAPHVIINLSTHRVKRFTVGCCPIEKNRLRASFNQDQFGESIAAFHNRK